MAACAFVAKLAAKAGNTVTLAVTQRPVNAGAVKTGRALFAIFAKVTTRAGITIRAGKAFGTAALAVTLYTVVTAAMLAAIRAGGTIWPKMAAFALDAKRAGKAFGTGTLAIALYAAITAAMLAAIRAFFAIFAKVIDIAISA